MRCLPLSEAVATFRANVDVEYIVIVLMSIVRIRLSPSAAIVC